MKLKSYFNPTAVNTVFTVDVRLATDAAPAAPYVALGDLIHEPVDDNASGMQKFSISHAIFQHVQEQVYLQHDLQDMQRIKIVNGGGFKLLTSIWVDKGELLVTPGEVIHLAVKVLPTDATVDGYYCQLENPTLGTVVDKSGGVFEITLPGDAQTIAKIGIKNTDIFELVPVEARTVVRQA